MLETTVKVKVFLLQRRRRSPMALPAIRSGELVALQELNLSSPFFKEGTSLRVTAKLQDYSVETAIVTVVDGNAKLRINAEHLRDISFRVGSVYQFIGELHIQQDNQAVLQARIGRNVDGINLNLYHQSLQLLRQFQGDRLKNLTT